MKDEAVNIYAKIGWPFILTVLLVYPLPQLAIDIYLPSWPAMLLALNTTKPLMQTSLTVYILFLGLAQLFYGPFSDKFGRKSTLIIGCSIFFISSVLAALVHSVNQLLFMRALQGIGMGCGFAVASAILADSFHGKQLARMTTYSAMIYSLSSILAPVIGGYLQQYIGWQANFIAMAIYGFLLLVLLWFFVFETNQHPNPMALSPGKFTRNYLSLLGNWNYIAHTICLTLVYGIMVTFSVVSPFVLQGKLHVSTVTYGELLFLVGISYFIGTTSNATLLKRLRMNTLIFLGFGITILSSFSLLMASILHWFSPASIILFTCLSILGVGFVFPNCFAKALDISPGKGVSGAFMGSAVLIGTSLISLIVTRLRVDSQFRLSCIYLALALLGILTYYSVRKRY